MGIDFIMIICLIWTALILIFFLFLARVYLNAISPSRRRQANLLPLVPTIAAVIPFFILVGFFGGPRLALRTLEFLKPGFFDLMFFFFSPEIRYSRSQNIRFISYKSSALSIVLISLKNVGARPDSCLILEPRLLFDYLLKAIKLLVTLFYFFSHQGFQIFLKIPNYCAFF